MNFLLVMIGGAVGSAVRYAVGRLTLGTLGPNYPWGTLAVNLIGGFTTFSAFSLDAALMIERGQWGVALAYGLVSVIGSVIALFAGLYLVRAVA